MLGNTVNNDMSSLCYGMWFSLDHTGFLCVSCLSWNSLDPASFELRDLPMSASQVLGLKCMSPLPDWECEIYLCTGD